MFRCALTEMETIDISLTSNGSSYVAQLPIGYEDTTDQRYSLMVAMDGVPGYGSHTKELVFRILAHDPDDEHFHQI